MELTQALEAVPTGERRRVDGARGTLVGGRCPACRTPCWPLRSICHACGGAGVAETAFATEGTLLTYTTVSVPRPGLPTPYVLAQVQVEDGPRIFGHLRGDLDGLHVPSGVRLVVAGDASRVPPFWFEVAA